MEWPKAIPHCSYSVAGDIHTAINLCGSLQHRGREAAGIAGISDKTIRVVKWIGTVKAIDLEDFFSFFPKKEKFHTFLAHTRYATAGGKNFKDILRDAHPHTIGGYTVDKGNHLIIYDCEYAMVHNGQVDDSFFQPVDRSDMQTGCDTEALLQYYKQYGVEQILRKIPHSYTLALADLKKQVVIVARDRMGVKPGVFGEKDGVFSSASEDIALRKNGAKFKGEIEPGCVYHINPGGEFHEERIVNPKVRHCMFEYNYIAHPDSIINGVPVRNIRIDLGRQLAKEFRFHGIDIVTHVPRCPDLAAYYYAREVGAKYLPVFYKLRGERSFQGSTQHDRELSIKSNLYLCDNCIPELKGKTVLVVDDSIIRGTNLPYALSFLDRAGVKKKYALSYTPQMCGYGLDGKKRYCKYGVDMPIEPRPGEEYIARGRDLAEISRLIGAETHYLSVEGMLDVFRKHGLKAENLCTFCIGGEEL